MLQGLACGQPKYNAVTRLTLASLRLGVGKQHADALPPVWRSAGVIVKNFVTMHTHMTKAAIAAGDPMQHILHRSRSVFVAADGAFDSLFAGAQATDSENEAPGHRLSFCSPCIFLSPRTLAYLWLRGIFCR
jgi:hypothetical protein